MSDREFVILCWRLMIEFVRGYGRKHDLCIDIQIVKRGRDESRFPPGHPEYGLDLVNN
jgi:hypothetical protein